MLEVQKYLQNNSLEALTEELGIKVCEHETLPLVILNYCQLNSPKTNDVVRECRGVVLEKDSWELVAKGFNRFFNWGEVEEELRLFNWDDCCIQSKEDGSFGMLYNYKGEWLYNTRATFGDMVIQFQEFTWRELFCKAIGIAELQDLDFLNPEHAQIFELVSPYNQVVRQYDSAVYLLSAFDGENELALGNSDVTAEFMREVRGLNVHRPEVWPFDNILDVENHVFDMSIKDRTFEGVVLRDSENRRWKIKSATYVALHRLRGEGDNLFNVKHQIRFILIGEEDEIIGYFPIAKDSILKHKGMIDDAMLELEKVWEECWEIESQKEFAIAILPKTRFFNLLFELRREHGSNQTLELLRTAWRLSDAQILKTLFDKTPPRKRDYHENS